jgi:hypothetical protein
MTRRPISSPWSRHSDREGAPRRSEAHCARRLVCPLSPALRELNDPSRTTAPSRPNRAPSFHVAAALDTGAAEQALEIRSTAERVDLLLKYSRPSRAPSTPARTRRRRTATEGTSCPTWPTHEREPARRAGRHVCPRWFCHRKAELPPIPWMAAHRESIPGRRCPVRGRTHCGGEAAPRRGHPSSPVAPARG